MAEAIVEETAVVPAVVAAAEYQQAMMLQVYTSSWQQ